MFYSRLRALRVWQAWRSSRWLVVVSGGLVAACASIGSPEGGLYDETPPVLRSVDPADGALHVDKRKFTLRFDENIKLDNVMDKMTISPPQEKAASVISNARTVTIELQDTLRANTTYTIDLGDAVQDNNEGNVLEHTAFAFSTGDHIDSLQISGYLLNASDLEPVTGAYVGIYNDTTSLGDSVFVRRAMERATKTDAYGAFTVGGIARGTYRLYALVDGNSNYRYDLSTEQIAFADSVFTPTMAGTLVHDTVWADSVTVDTVLTRGRIVYTPVNVVLRLFNEGRSALYLEDNSRPDSVRLSFKFSAACPTLPQLHVVGRDSVDAVAGSLQSFVAEPNAARTEVNYWICDSTLYCRDTLFIAATYTYTDSAMHYAERTDTLRFVRPAVRSESSLQQDDKADRGKGGRGRRRKKDQPVAVDSTEIGKPVMMTVSCITGAKLDIGQKPRFEVSEPLQHLDLSGLHMERKVNDSAWVRMPMRWETDTVVARIATVYVEPHYSPGGTYRLTVDSAAMRSVYGHPVDRTVITFSELTQADYAHLLFEVVGAPDGSVMELLDEVGACVVSTPLVEGGKAKFVNVKPGTYYAHLIVDDNGNGRFDPGSLAEHRQPEMVYYFDTSFDLRANWSVSQHWDVRTKTLYEQKPDAIKVNKPKEKEERASRNAEYYARHGITPPQTGTGTTTSGASSARMHSVK